MRPQRNVLLVMAALIGLIVPLIASAAPPAGQPGAPQLLTTLPGGAASGSTVGPDGALYVPQPAAGEIWRVDPDTGAKSLYASGLPQRLVGPNFGGVMDVAFMGSTAYAIVTVVGSFPALVGCPQPKLVGLYRVGPTSSTMVADIGNYACANLPPPNFGIVVKSGVQYAMQPFRGGFLVTDGHHNRVYRVGLDGSVSTLIQFGDIVPTGLDVQGNTIFMAEAGPVPHLPQNGKIVSFEPGSSSATEVAHGAPLLVDVERGRGESLFGLAQGFFPSNDPNDAGSPAAPDTGSLVKANGDGSFTTIADKLDRPTSLEIIGTTAYVITLEGEIWKVDNISGPPYGK